MTDSFDEAVKKLKGPDFEDRGQMFPHFDKQAAAEYLRENFMPRTDDRRRTMWDAYRMCEQLLHSAKDLHERDRMNTAVCALYTQFQRNWGAQVPRF